MFASTTSVFISRLLLLTIQISLLPLPEGNMLGNITFFL
jgi:hypothetical protein